MVKFDRHTSGKTGITKTQVRVTAEVPIENGKYSKRTIKNFGYLEEQPNQNEFLEMVRRFDKEYKEGKVVLSLFTDKSCLDISNKSYNFGYRYLESIYDFLEIDEFIESHSSKTSYDLREVFKYDVLMRILCPGSKRSSIQLKDCLYNGDYSFRLYQNYRSLSYYAKWQDELLRHINTKIRDSIGRNDEYALYDCTNYYFEKDFPSGMFQRGVSKEHRTEPIVQMGLFIDSNSIPITFSTFPGNTADSYTLRPVMKEVNENYGLKRIIIVGDKGFNTKANIIQIINDGNGFVFSNKLRGRGKTKPKYQDKCFDTSNWVGNDNFKYTIFEDEISSKDLSSFDKVVKIKVLIYYKREIAELEKARREEKIEKAKEYLETNPGLVSMASSKLANKYIVGTPVIEKTGEVCDKQIIDLDKEKIKEEEKLDGFFCLITSETEFDYKQIMSSYSQLWMIEDSFRISKSDIEIRPAYIWTEDHLKGYFVETFVALLIIRLFQFKMGENKISAQRIIECLNSCNCNMINEDAVHIERIGGRNAYFYKKFGSDKKEKSTLNTIKEIIEDGSINSDDLSESQIDQIQNDYIKINKTFRVIEPRMWMRKKQFDELLKKINFSTIFQKIKNKPGRPKKNQD